MTAAPITRDDIEAKFRELQGEVDDTVEQSVSVLLIAGAAVALGVLAAAFFVGKRRGRKRTTVVEIRRI